MKFRPFAVDRNAAAAPNAAQPVRTLAIASGKGGVGKTWLAVTLTHALARSGRKALLFDGDLGLANVDVQLGIVPERDIGSVISGNSTLARAVTRYAPGGFDLLIGTSGGGGVASLAPARLASLGNELAALSGGYDATVIDIGAGLDRTVRRFSQLAEACLVVTTDEPTALTDAYAFIKLGLAERPDMDMRVVVNMAGSLAMGERTFASLSKACRTFLKYEPILAGIVRRDPRVPEAIRHQMPLLTRSPIGEASADVEALAGRLFG
jgi:flagellar biosynthesis protein FlhG